MPRHSSENHGLSRRTLLKGLGFAPLLLRASPLHRHPLLFGDLLRAHDPALPFADTRLRPHYPAKSPLESVLRLVPPGSDGYVTEKYAFEIESLLVEWSSALKSSVRDLSVLAGSLHASIEASSLTAAKETKLR